MLYLIALLGDVPCGKTTKNFEMPCCKKVCPILFKPKFSKAIWLLTLLNLPVVLQQANLFQSTLTLDSLMKKFPPLKLCAIAYSFPAGAGHPLPLTPLLTPHCFRRIQCEDHPLWEVFLSLIWLKSSVWGVPRAYPVFLSPGHETLYYNYMPVTICLPLKFLEGRGHILFLLLLRV